MTIELEAPPRALAPGDGLHLDMFGALATFKAFTAETNGAYCVFEGRIAPGAVMPLHFHPHDDESFFILDGQFAFQLGEQHINAATGTFALVPRGTVHGYQNIGATPGRLLVIVSPGDIHEQHFLHYGRRLADAAAPLSEPSADDIARYLAEAPQYGIVPVRSVQGT